MNDNIQNEKNKLRRLVQFKKLDDSALQKIAEKNVVLKELIESGNFTNAEEKSSAKKIFEAYLSQHTFESFSDLSTLSVLVYNEILLGRTQKAINGCTNKEGESYISDKLLTAHSSLTNQILSLKTKLGIDRATKTDEFSAFQLLKKRFVNHINENKNEFTLTVPYKCSACAKEDVKMVLLRKRVKDFEVLEHPHFAGRFWYNKVAIDMVKSGKLKKEDYAKIFSTTVDYVNWCIANEGKII